ncbi:MAG: HD domain-containing protein, partial [Pseudomonadota bacterium]
MEKSLTEHIQHFKDRRELIRKAGTLGRESIHELSVITDVFLVSVFSQAERKWHKSGKGTPRSVAMVPTGGYGRSELCFHSDIDLMILYGSGTDPVAEFISEQIFYPLWDSGIQIGHCIRTVDDCVEVARENLSTQTSFLDARCLAGNRELFKKFQKAFTGNIINDRRRGFLDSLVEEDQKRYRIYGEAAFLLEPNVKEGKGGLRDYHSIVWAAKALFNLQNLEALESAAVLSQKERAWLEESLEFFWNVRSRLHILSKRKNDRLFFEYQEDVAKAIGFKPGPDSLDVEEFMKAFYSHASRIEYLSSLFFERVFHTLRIKPASGTVQPHDLIIEKDISIYKGEIKVEKPEIFAGKPYLLMKLFEYAAKYEVQLHPKTCQAIMDNLDLVDDTFRSSRKVARSMMKLMSLGAKAFGPLELMLKTGLLSRYIPEFSNIVCQVQHDSYHLYTVDKHSLLTFLELGLLRDRNAGPFTTSGEPEYLFLTALLHDIGKGFGRNHAEKGADLIRTICRRMGIRESVADEMSFLIRHHL